MQFNSEIDNSSVFYTYDGTFDGLMTVIYTAVYSRKVPHGIFKEENMQFSLGARYINVKTDFEKSKRVTDAVFKKIGDFGLKRLQYVFLSSFPDKDIVIYNYMMLAFKNGSITNSYLSNDTVLRASQIAQNVSRETEKFRQFIRFSVMDSGIQYARFIPENNVLPLIMPFFIKRLKTIPFVLHDPAHEICGIYDTKESYITSSKGLVPPRLGGKEKEVRALWNTFFNSISIKERENLRLQKQMMPARYFRQ